MRNTLLTILLPTLLLFACNGTAGEGVKTQKEAEIGISEINNKEIVTFVYHRFGDGRYSSTNVNLKDFEAHLNYLKKNDYQVLSLSEAIRYLKSEAAKQKTAVITIDDGYKSFFKNGLPLLKKYDFPATLFINTKTVGAGDYMNWEEIKVAMNYKIEIGNHTHSHDYFLNLPISLRYSVFDEEIKLSQQLIEKNTGFTPIVFAYPYGELDPKMKEIVAESGFKAAAAQNSGVISSITDLMQCPRFPMSEQYADPDKFITKAKMMALTITAISPKSFIVPESQSQPALQITFRQGDLQLNQLQCFIQGTGCNLSSNVSEDGIVTLVVQPKTSIADRRRTLYTITVPDNKGNWHWFSHLFINSTVN